MLIPLMKSQVGCVIPCARHMKLAGLQVSQHLGLKWQKTNITGLHRCLCKLAPHEMNLLSTLLQLSF